METRNTAARLEALEKAIEEQTSRHTASEARFNARFDEQAARFEQRFEQLTQLLTTSLGGNFLPGNSSSNSTTPPNILTTTPLALQQTMELPTFDGSDAISWLSRANQYFLVHNTPQEQRVRVALIALSGPAMAWIQLLLRRSPLLTWEQFSVELLSRFGKSAALDGYEALRITVQDGSLDDYIAAFEARLAQLPDIADHQYLGYFLGGLKPDIRLQIKDTINSYAAAVQTAKRIDLMTLASTPTSRFTGQSTMRNSLQPVPSYNRSPIQRPNPHPGMTGSFHAGSQNTRRFRNLSSEEIRKHIAAGTCFKCGLKFGPTHRCPPKTLQVIVGDDDDDPGETFHDAESGDSEDTGSGETVMIQHLQLSELTSNGLDSCQTMKLFGRVGDRRMKLMIDSGASHCFITEEAARKLLLEINPTDKFSVVLGNGSRERTGGICLKVPLCIDSHIFEIDCYVFPLNNVDIILGVSWLAKLGEVKANWKTLTMEFIKEGQAVRLSGDPTLTRRECSAHELRHLEDEDNCWLLWAMEQGPTEDTFGFSSSLSAAAR